MKCPYCNTEIEDESVFCPECGNSLVDYVSPDQPIGQKPIGRYPAGQEPIDQNPAGQETIIPPPIRQESIRRESIRREPIRQAPMRKPPVKKKSKTPLIILGVVASVVVLGGVGFLAGTLIQNIRENKTQESASAGNLDDSGTSKKKRIGSSEDTGDAGEMSGSGDAADAAGNEVIAVPSADSSSEEEPQINPEDVVVGFCDPPAQLAPYMKLEPTQAGASSSLFQEGADSPNDVWKVLDGVSETTWQDGVDGDGIGESLWFQFGEEKKIKYLSFRLGNWKTKEYAVGNNRPKTLDITIGDFGCEVEFPKEQREYWLELSEPFPASEIEIVIEEVYKGTSWDDTCIAEIGMYGE
ncbi:MAG: zinc ribbon domain-containing protein [Clostridia bacterium]|nr:zinc ribbon domain-containing protein [Clostridia bacterium]NCC42079.1 zinc ribbon domain-containing protein [Clostridia bacterium]